MLIRTTVYECEFYLAGYFVKGSTRLLQRFDPINMAQSRLVLIQMLRSNAVVRRSVKCSTG